MTEQNQSVAAGDLLKELQDAMGSLNLQQKADMSLLISREASRQMYKDAGIPDGDLRRVDFATIAQPNKDLSSIMLTPETVAKIRGRLHDLLGSNNA